MVFDNSPGDCAERWSDADLPDVEQNRSSAASRTPGTNPRLLRRETESVAHAQVGETSSSTVRVPDTRPPSRHEPAQFPARGSLVLGAFM